MSEGALPSGRPLLAWYGDDFTGASAVMEALTFGGVPSVLFLEPPSEADRAAFPECRALGVAGIARSQGPAWMDGALPGMFARLAALDPAIVLYKVCSTFDSSATVGSIGRAFDLGRQALGGDWTPLLVASPPHRRFQAFGNLFAAAGAQMFRLDRHPTMRRHPATPMAEADLGRHLASQTAQPVGLVDLSTMKRGEADAALSAEIAAGRTLVSLDVIDDETLEEAGRLIWQNRGARLFVVGSQGVAYALLAHWRAAGLLGAPATPPRVAPVSRIAAVSGSCSPLTATQIAWARAHGFRGIRLDAIASVDQAAWRGAVRQAVAEALRALSEGSDPLVFTAEGPEDVASGRLHAAIAVSGSDSGDVHRRIAAGLGEILAETMRVAGLERGVIAGGDTSSHATAALGVKALTALAPTVAGAALFRAHPMEAGRSAIELGLKGGQMGDVDYFGGIKGAG